VTWLDAWSDVLRLCNATGINSIEEFDDGFPYDAVAAQLEPVSRLGWKAPDEMTAKCCRP